MKNKYVVLLICLLLLFCFGLLGILLFNNKDSNVKAEKSDSLKEEIKNEPDSNEPYKESTVVESKNTDEKEEIEIKYDQYVIANGYMGASDNAYYTRNGNLYHLVISTNQSIKLAEGVEKIEEDKDSLLVYKGKNFKIVNEDNYVTYIG